MQKFLLLVCFLSAASAATSQQNNVGCFSIGGSSYDYAKSMVVTYDDNYVVAGLSGSFSASQNCYIAKVSPVGDVIWSHAFGGNFTDVLYNVIEATDHSIVATGASDGSVLVVKYNDAGVQQWNKKISAATGDVGYAVVETPDGGFFVAGHNDVSRAYLVKLDANGNKLWEKTLYNQNNPFESTTALCAGQTVDGRLLVGGWCPGVPNYSLVMCLDQNGVILWSKQSDYAGVNYAFAATPDSGFAMVGFNYRNVSDAQLVKFDKDGNTEFSRVYSDSIREIFYSIDVTTDGGFIMAGEAKNDQFPPNSIQLAYIVKTDSLGNVEWSKVLGSPPSVTGKFEAVHQTSDGGYVAAGAHNNDGANVFIAKFDANGNICAACNANGPYGIDNLGEQYVDVTMVEVAGIGAVTDFAPADVSAAGSSLTMCMVTGVNALVDESMSVFVSPNPSSHETTIEFSILQTENVSVSIYDVTGRRVATLVEGMLPSGRHRVTWNVANQNAGVYFLKFRGGQRTVTEKLVVAKP